MDVIGTTHGDYVFVLPEWELRLLQDAIEGRKEQSDCGTPNREILEQMMATCVNALNAPVNYGRQKCELCGTSFSLPEHWEECPTCGYGTLVKDEG